MQHMVSSSITSAIFFICSLLKLLRPVVPVSIFFQVALPTCKVILLWSLPKLSVPFSCICWFPAPFHILFRRLDCSICWTVCYGFPMFFYPFLFLLLLASFTYINISLMNHSDLSIHSILLWPFMFPNKNISPESLISLVSLSDVYYFLIFFINPLPVHRYAAPNLVRFPAIVPLSQRCSLQLSWTLRLSFPCLISIPTPPCFQFWVRLHPSQTYLSTTGGTFGVGDQSRLRCIRLFFPLKLVLNFRSLKGFLPPCRIM